MDKFIGFNWGLWFNIPPIGSSWTQAFCEGICESVVSQRDADLCAARLSLLCAMYSDGGGSESGGGIGFPDIHPWLVNGQQVQTFGNESQTCTVRCPDGTSNSYTIVPGTFIARSQQQANNMAHSEACGQAELNRMCIDDISPVLCADPTSSKEPQSFKFTATSALPIRWSANGLPDNMTLDPDTGVVTGNPTTAGDYSVVVTTTNSNGATKTKMVNVGVFGLRLTNQTIPTVGVDHAYSFTLTAVGGTGDVVFSFGAGSLPGGVTGDDSGNITGTPVAVGTYVIPVTITDTDGDVCDQVIFWTVHGPKFVSPFPPDGTICVNYNSAVLTSPSGSVFSASGLPTGLTMASNGTITGKPTSSGNFSVHVTATNAGQSNDITIHINIPTPTAANAAAVKDMVWNFVSGPNDPGASASGSAAGGSGNISAVGACNAGSAQTGVGKLFTQLKNCSGHSYNISISVGYSIAGGACGAFVNPVGEVIILINGSTVRDAPSLTGSGTVNLIGPFSLADGGACTFEIDCFCSGNGTGTYSISVTPLTPP